MGLRAYAGSSRRPTEMIISELHSKGTALNRRKQFY